MTVVLKGSKALSGLGRHVVSIVPCLCGAIGAILPRNDRLREGFGAFMDPGLPSCERDQKRRADVARRGA